MQYAQWMTFDLFFIKITKMTKSNFRRIHCFFFSTRMYQEMRTRNIDYYERNWINDVKSILAKITVFFGKQNTWKKYMRQKLIVIYENRWTLSTSNSECCLENAFQPYLLFNTDSSIFFPRTHTNTIFSTVNLNIKSTTIDCVVFFFLFVFI